MELLFANAALVALGLTVACRHSRTSPLRNPRAPSKT